MPDVLVSIYPDKIRKLFKEVDGCWLWQKNLTSTGYARRTLNIEGKRVHQAAHRWCYEYVFGKIKEGLVLDHLCRNRACVNPNHLEPVTNRVNILRGVGISALNAVKTVCPKGHTYDEANIIRTQTGGRRCRICQNNYWNKWYKRKNLKVLENV